MALQRGQVVVKQNDPVVDSSREPLSAPCEHACDVKYCKVDDRLWNLCMKVGLTQIVPQMHNVGDTHFEDD